MSEENLTILGKSIAKGQSSYLKLEIAKLHTRNSIHIPIIVERSKKDGPVLLLMAGIHGDEINGVAIIRKIIKDKLNRPKSGTVICIPVINVFGYLNMTREFPDGKDLNRVFPGSASGSLASQFAYQFRKEIAPHVDYILDFHTGGAERENFPQVRCMLQDKATMRLAKIFDIPFIVHSNFIHKTVRETVSKMGKTILLFEGGKSKNLDEDVIQYGLDGAKNLMSFLGLQDGPLSQKNKTIIIKKSKWLRAPVSGMLHLRIANGTFVKKGTLLAIITDFYGDFEKKVKALADCHIFCINTAPIVNKGDALFNVSTETA